MGNKKQKPLTARDVLEGQERWLKRNLLATIVIALTTALYMVTTIPMLRQMKEDNGVQREYYEKTVRPFVYIEDIKLEDFIETDQDTTMSIKYYLKNAGALPAKSVKVKTLWDKTPDEHFKTVTSEEFAFKPLVGSIFPNQTVSAPADITASQSSFSLSIIKQKPYLHAYIAYNDAGGKLYFNKTIGKIRTSTERDQIEWDILSIWVDFD